MSSTTASRWAYPNPSLHSKLSLTLTLTLTSTPSFNSNPNPNPNPNQVAGNVEHEAEVETRDRHSLVSLTNPNEVDEEDERHLRDEQVRP